MADVLHSVYAPAADRRGPDSASSGSGHKLRRLNRHAYNLSDGVAGSIDVALWDIAGKVANQPIAVLLGLAREKVPAYATARPSSPTPETVFKEAKQREVRRASTASRSSSGTASTRDIPRFRAAREAVGDDFPLMQDAAGCTRYARRSQAGQELGGLNYYWFEEPIPDRNTFQLKRLTDSLDVPILAGETLRVHELAEQMRDRRLRHRARRRPPEGGHHRASQGGRHGRPAGLRPRGPRRRAAAARAREPPRLAAMTNGRWCETFHPVYGLG